MTVGINVTGGYTNVDSLSSPYSLNGQFSPEIAAEEQALNRRQQIANLLMQRGLQSPQGQMAGRFYVAPSWVQGLSQLGSAAAGASLTKANDADRAGLADKQREITAQAVQNFINKTSGQPQQVPVQGPGIPQQKDVLEVDPYIQRMRGLSGDEQNPSVVGMRATQQAAQERGPQMYQEGPQPSITTMQPPNERDYRKAIVDAMTSGVPGLKEIAMWTASQREKAQDTAAQREFLKEEKGLDRDVRRESIESNAAMRSEQIRGNMILTQMQIESREQAGKDATDLKRELARQSDELQKSLHAMDIQGRKEVAQIAADGKSSAKLMSPTVQKELFDTDDAINASKGVIAALDRALAINEQAYDGVAADKRAAIASNIPGVGKEGANATVELDNIITGQALGQLRSAFGSNPTEGERKILLDVQGSVNMTIPQRKAIWDRAKVAVQERMKQQMQKAEKIRAGTYFEPGGGAAASPSSPTGPTKISTDAEYNALPSGATYIAPDGSTRTKK